MLTFGSHPNFKQKYTKVHVTKIKQSFEFDNHSCLVEIGLEILEFEIIDILNSFECEILFLKLKTRNYFTTVT